MEGDLLMFPSSLFHRTMPFYSDETRLSVSFDLMPGETGSEGYRPRK
ncbi:MAG: putative 2OG-Fe(II) oxygenase [Gammaproteobacteria bacterium]